MRVSSDKELVKIRDSFAWDAYFRFASRRQMRSLLVDAELALMIDEYGWLMPAVGWAFIYAKAFKEHERRVRSFARAQLCVLGGNPDAVESAWIKHRLVQLSSNPKLSNMLARRRLHVLLGVGMMVGGAAIAGLMKNKGKKK